MANIKSVNKDLANLLSTLKNLETQFVGTQKVIDSGVTSIDEHAKKAIESSRALSGANKEHRETITKEQKAAQELINAKNGLIAAGTKQTQLTLTLKKSRQDLIAQQKLQIAAGKGEVKTYDQLSARYRLAAKSAKDLAAQYGANSKQARGAISSAKEYNNQLKNIDKSLGNHQRNVGNYTQGIKNLAAGYIGLRSVIGIFKNIGAVVTNFSKSQSNLAAVLGKSKDEINDLAEDAKKYGSQTAFTASNVSDLQTELAKLGFTQNEIKSSTEAVLDFAQATGAELGEAAKVTGAALRAFGLDATESGRVTSVLAVATSKSALAFADYETALSTVAPVAKAFGFGIEDSVAMLGKLKDAGFDASTAATSTRNILLNLADSNGALAKKLGGSVKSFDQLIPALVKLRKEGVDLNETLQLTDKRSVAAFNQFLEGAESASTLRDSLIDVGDEMQKMVDTQLDNLTGDTTKLTSAWQGLILSLEDGTGVLSKAARSVVQLGTQIVDGFRLLAIGREKYSEEFQKALIGEAIKNDMDEVISYYKDVYGEGEVVNKLNEDLQINLSEINELNQQILETEGKRGKENKKHLDQLKIRLIREQMFYERNLQYIKTLSEAKTIQDERDAAAAIKAGVEQERADAESIKDREKRNKALYAADFKLVKLNQELALLNFKNAGASSEEIRIFKLDQKQKLYTEEIRLAEKYAQELGDTEIKILKEKIQEANLEKLKGAKESPAMLDIDTDSITDEIEAGLIDERKLVEEDIALKEKLRLDAAKQEIEDDKEKQEQIIDAARQGGALLMDVLTMFADQRLELANRAVEDEAMQTDAAENNLNRQIALAEAGHANDVSGAQRALDLQKATQQKALDEKKSALAQKQRLEAIEQGTSIITAVANIIQGFSTIPIVGWALGLAAGGAMLAGFISQKRQSKAATQTFGEGGVIDLEGGSHASGNDIHFGNKDGKELRAEGGEKAVIFSKKATSKYGDEINRFARDANRLKLEDRSRGAFNLGSLPIYVENNSNFDTRETNDLLKKLVALGGVNSLFDPVKNRRVDKVGNKTVITNG